MSETAPEQTSSMSAAQGGTPAIMLDGVRYPLDQLNDSARGTVASIRFCDDAIQQRRNELAVADTARMAYAAALKREMGTKTYDATQTDVAQTDVAQTDVAQTDTEGLSDIGKAQVASLQLVEPQMQKLRNEIALFKTARRTYARALEKTLKSQNQKD